MLVVMCAQMVDFLASDWFSLVANRKCNRGPVVAKGMAGSPEVTWFGRGNR